MPIRALPENGPPTEDVAQYEPGTGSDNNAVENNTPAPEKKESTNEEIIELRQNELFEAMKKAGVLIDAKAWRRLIPSVDVHDFSSDPRAQELVERYGLSKIFAKCESDGSISFDESYKEKNEMQQLLIMAHEFGHRLDVLLRHVDNPKYQDILRYSKQVTPDQASFYVAGLDKTLGEEPDKDHKIEREKMAEFFAQFIIGGGTLGGMIRMKRLQYPGEEDKQALAEKYAVTEELMAKIDHIDEMDEAERVAFLAENPDLVAHYNIVLDLRGILSDQAAIEKITDSGDLAFMEEYFDDEDLFLNIPEQMPDMVQSWGKRSSSGGSSAKSAATNNNYMPNVSWLLNPFEGIFR